MEKLIHHAEVDRGGLDFNCPHCGEGYTVWQIDEHYIFEGAGFAYTCEKCNREIRIRAIIEFKAYPLTPRD